MNYCASIRKKGSLDQCTARPIRGHTLCGRHIRCKQITLWTSTQTEKAKSLIPLQAFVRGWLVRKRLKLGGPGVLCRKNLVNDEDLHTCETKERQHPFEYFGFEEGGKLWWFDWETLWTWSLSSTIPTNPYTKVPLSIETRKRLREGFAYRIRHSSFSSRMKPFRRNIRYRWNFLVQIFEENGFGTIEPNIFLNMRKVHFVTFFTLLQDDLSVIFGDKIPFKKEFIRSCIHIRKLVFKMNTESYIIECLDILILFVSLFKDCYILLFSILSALYRC